MSAATLTMLLLFVVALVQDWPLAAQLAVVAGAGALHAVAQAADTPDT